jgi:hypothetical protein
VAGGANVIAQAAAVEPESLGAPRKSGLTSTIASPPSVCRRRYARAKSGSMPPLVAAMMLIVPVGAIESRVALRTRSPCGA